MTFMTTKRIHRKNIYRRNRRLSETSIIVVSGHSRRVMPSPCTAVGRGLERGEAAVMFAGNNSRLYEVWAGSFGNLGLRDAPPCCDANAVPTGRALVLAGKCGGYGI